MVTQTMLLAALLWTCALTIGAQDLSALEQRTEALRAQLRDVTDKEAALRTRAQQLDEELKPENAQNRAALTGMLDGAAARERVRQQLEGERARTQQQLDLLATSRSHLETAITEAEAEGVRRRAAALAPAPAPVTTKTPQATTSMQASVPPRPVRRRQPARRVRARKPARRSR